ncbi:MAG: hypothetical protein ACOX6K_01020 [Sphaerochaetaceae bacterium]|jgi:hypothetical protein
MKRFLACFICLLLLGFGLSAGEITAQYDPVASLVFESGYSPLPTSKLIAYVGTITFFSSDGQLIAPNLVNVTLTTNFYFTGPVTWWNDSQTNEPVYTENYSSEFYLYSVVTVNGETQVNPLYEGDETQPLVRGNATVNVSQLVVKLYLVSIQEAYRYKPGGTYALTSGSLGSFFLATAESVNNSGGGPYTPIEVNGTAAGTSTPLLASGSATPEPVPYGDPEETPVEYLFLIDDDVAFTRSSAYGASSSKVATANLTVSNASSDKTYGVDVVFSNAENGTSFSLHLNGDASLYAIPYVLRFNGEDVVGGTPISWSPVVNGINSKDIYITGISSSTAEAAPAGTYTDTITVTVTPKDTI